MCVHIAVAVVDLDLFVLCLLLPVVVLEPFAVGSVVALVVVDKSSGRLIGAVGWGAGRRAAGAGAGGTRRKRARGFGQSARAVC
ncbi:hypothetical protein BpHYR1_022081 [Brachionus plicatilis]|uniref:Uncharacterized protein n=1 Tax=Brachionus plicatilis TaxID=10195 RepID=A0A3M7S5W6_BRAPC|nr:hypothetical protein BpHYR1_022081 [Brachionus plicatilis]